MFLAACAVVPPVPPLAIATVPVTFAAVPVVFWLPAVLTPGKLMLAEPLNDTPPMVRAVWRVVAVAALPVVLWFSVGKVQFVKVPEDGVPSAGVTSVGEVANTKAPEPVSFVTAAARLAEEGVAKNVATPAPRPLTPVEMGKPVVLVRTPDVGVPNAGVTSVGLVANTKAPEPVSSVTAAARFALDGVPKKVATPAPKEVKPVPPLATGRVPDTWVAKPIFP